jgi:hypothetical protein
MENTAIQIQKHKIGNSIIWDLKHKSNIALTNFKITVTATNKFTENITLFTISSDTPTANAYITTDKFPLGEFSVIMKDTSTLVEGDYYIDIAYESQEGFKHSTRTFLLRLAKRV